MELRFAGAAGEVTGSKHILTTSQAKVLLDCGLFQGHHHDDPEVNRRLPIPPAELDAVVVSHAHLDHVGMLPLLVKAGYNHPIYATRATAELAELIMLDAAKLQEQDALFAKKHNLPDSRRYEPLYTQDDVPPVMALMKPLPYAFQDPSWHQIAAGIEIKFLDAGHILGSSVILFKIQDNGKERTMAFTGDLGRFGMPLLRDPDFPTDPVETLISEATYGTRLHHPVETVDDQLVGVVKEAIERKGRIVVPAFSLGRTQALIYLLHRLTDQGKLPRIPIIVDSPLAQRINDVYERHQREYDAETAKDFTQAHEDPLEFRNLQYTHTVDESKALNTLQGPAMIISASGMATGGRVMHHLKNCLPDPSTIVLITGYQAYHTTGRQLVDGFKSVRIFGQSVPVNARIETVNDLSAHADGHELQQYAEHCQTLKNVFLVHSEHDRADALRVQMTTAHPDWNVRLPVKDERYVI